MSNADPRGIALVTGGSRGIGAATVRALAADGYTVAFSFRVDDDAAAEVVRAVRSTGGHAVAIRADAGVGADLEALFRSVDDLGAPLRVLVNNAATLGPISRFADVDVPALRRVVEVNLVGAMLCIQLATMRMSARAGGAGGSIVNVSSGAARHGSPGTSVHYAATKGGLESLTIGLAQELAVEAIRVNAVAPGLIQTDMPDPQVLARADALVPQGRAGSADEVANAISWLVSDKATYVSGAIMRIAGGLP